MQIRLAYSSDVVFIECDYSNVKMKVQKRLYLSMHMRYESDNNENVYTIGDQYMQSESMNEYNDFV